ncbi:MAG: hypothetical protein CRN43_15165, partial [Candidatus Nephrothrix sp. EaCA]
FTTQRYRFYFNDWLCFSRAPEYSVNVKEFEKLITDNLDPLIGEIISAEPILKIPNKLKELNRQQEDRIKKIE